MASANVWAKPAQMVQDVGVPAPSIFKSVSKDGEIPAEPAAHITGVAADAAPHTAATAVTGALAALAQLPENQRQALILTKVHGRSIADAAMITGSTPGAIKQRAHRAYVTLRQLLGRKELA